MLDILNIKPGDRIEYGPYLCSEALQNEHFTGIYRDFTFWSPDNRPVELWLTLIGQEAHNAGLSILVRASQVTNVYPARGIDEHTNV